MIYQLPFGNGKRFANTSNPVLNAIIGGWQTSNIFLVQSGPFLTPLLSGIDPSGTGSGIVHGRPQHPDRVGPWAPARQNAAQWILSTGFVCPGPNPDLVSCSVGAGVNAPPPIGRFGTSGVGIIEGPGTINWDFAMSKSFNLTERVKLRVEVSFVNFLNHLNLGVPDMNLADPNDPVQTPDYRCGFGCITSAQGLYQFAGARSGQIGARIDF